MDRLKWRIPGIAVAAAAALSAGAALATPPMQALAEATLPEAAFRITNWGLDGDRGMWIEAGKQSYYGEFLSPCVGAVPEHIIFRFNPDGSLNRFSKVIVSRERQVCAFKSFHASAEVPAKARAQEVT
jgi:hypothetical protein